MSKFWGLTVSGGKKFKHQVPETFCVSGAALEPVDGVSGPIQLYLQQNNSDILLCSLSPPQAIFPVGLNVRVGSGETVGFHLKGGGAGKAKVHLTGFTLPQDNLLLTPSQSSASKAPQKSILVTQPKSDGQQKKRVSIQETEPSYGEREMESSDDEAVSNMRKKLFNGESLQDDSDDDDEDENSDSDLNEDELKELQQLKMKGKYNPETGGKVEEDDDDDDDDSDLELLDDDDSEEDDDDDDDDDDEDTTDEEEKGENGGGANLKSKHDLNNLKAKIKKQLNSANSTPKNAGGKNAAGSANATPSKTPENKALGKVKTPSSAGNTPMKAFKTFSKGGVLVNEVQMGNGQPAKLGRMVTVYYAGRLKSNNKMFDSTQTGPGFKFRLGKGEVIRGWDLGVEGMKVGGKRRLTIPAQLAYGKKGAPPDIPPNSTLVFDVELKNVS